MWNQFTGTYSRPPEFNSGQKEQIKKAVDTNKWKVIVSAMHYNPGNTGDQSQIDFALAHLAPLGIADITRTGIIALNLEN